jgi:transposase
MCSTGCFTKDLKEPVEELKKEGITGAAMEATGVYRKSLYEMPEEADIRVTLINPGHCKNSGRLQTEENDSIRIHPYHPCGLLRHSHIAAEAYRELRGCVHECSAVRKQKSQTPTRIQRLLTVMNIRLQHQVNDIEGVGAMNVLRATALGTDDARKLVELMHTARFKAGREEPEASLEGNYRPHSVAMLKMKPEEYDFFVARMKNMKAAWNWCFNG